MVYLDKIKNDILWVKLCLDEHEELNNYTEGDMEYFSGLLKAYINMLDIYIKNNS